MGFDEMCSCSYRDLRAWQKSDNRSADSPHNKACGRFSIPAIEKCERRFSPYPIASAVSTSFLAACANETTSVYLYSKKGFVLLSGIDSTKGQRMPVEELIPKSRRWPNDMDKNLWWSYTCR
jgi:hypothetical protein